jgi:hypothetical protein
MFWGDYAPINRRKNCVYATFCTCYSVWMTVWYAGWKYQVSQKQSCFSWWRAHSRPVHLEIDKYTKNKLCTKLPLFTRFYRDARSTNHKRQKSCKLSQLGEKFIFSIFINLQMFRVTMCPSSISICFGITCTKCRINTVVSPDVGSRVPRNM